MITAKMAKANAEMWREQNTAMKDLHRVISEMSAQGNTFIQYKVPSNINEITMGELETLGILGYNVELLPNLVETWYKISWE